MREMGARTNALHDQVARAALAAGIDVIGAVGEFEAAFARVESGSNRVLGAPDPDALWERLSPRIDRNAAILLKGSRGVRLERLVPRLESWAGVASGTGETS
jgi:UDP-N-acetylmuramoyl-tripeptide--D-alanyl-D-alanine ligase